MSDAVAAMQDGAGLPGGLEMLARGAARAAPGAEDAWNKALAMGQETAAGAAATNVVAREGEAAGARSVQALDVIARGVLLARGIGLAGEATGDVAETAAVTDEDAAQTATPVYPVTPADAAALMARFAALEQSLAAPSEDGSALRAAVQPDGALAVSSEGEVPAIAARGVPADVTVRAFSTHVGPGSAASATLAGRAIDVAARARMTGPAATVPSALQPLDPAAGEEAGASGAVATDLFGDGSHSAPGLAGVVIGAVRGGREAGTATGGSFGDTARGSAEGPLRVEGEGASADIAPILSEAHEIAAEPVLARADGVQAAAIGPQMPGGHVAGQIAVATLNALADTTQPMRPDQAAAAAAANVVRADLSSSVPAVVRQLTIELEPGDLGRVSIDLRLRGDRLEIAFQPEKGGTQRIIEDQLGDIGKRLADAGFALDAAAVRAPDRAESSPASSDQSGFQRSAGESAFGQDGRGFGRNRGRDDATPEGAGAVAVRERQPPSSHGEPRSAAVAGVGRFI